MLGRYTPLFGLAFAYIPGIDMFRRPADASFVFSAALALLCGHLLTDYIRNGLPRARPRRGACGDRSFRRRRVGDCVLGPLGPRLCRAGRGGEGYRHSAACHRRPAARENRARARSIAAVLAVVAIAELMWWNTAFRLNAEPRANYAVLEQPSGAEAEAIAILDRELQRDRARGERPRVEVAGLGGAWQNLAMVRGWAAINGYNPLRIGDYDRLVSPGEEQLARRSCENFRSRSAATTARSPARSA